MRNDKRHKEGGGVLMYIRNGLPFKRRCDLECNLMEIMCIEIRLSNKSLLLATLYRPPDDDSSLIHEWLTCMEELLKRMYSENKPIILMGDFNIDLLSDKNSTLKTSWTDLVTDMGLEQVNKWTHQSNWIKWYSHWSYIHLFWTSTFTQCGC